MLTINTVQVEIFKFPGGEINIRLPQYVYVNNEIRIRSLLKNSDDIMALLLTVDAVRRQKPEIRIDLILPYFPYGRQDRACNHGEALSVSVMARLINSLKCNRVYLLDPHSDVTPALINNCEVKTIAHIFIDWCVKLDFRGKFLTFVCSDSGMDKKINSILKFSDACSDEVVRGIKHRNSLTGKIESIEIINRDFIFNRDLLVVDDLCDGGATFIELAKKIKRDRPNSLSLYVTHGIFSKGLDELFNYYDNIYCYYTFLENPPERLTIIGDIRNAY